MIGSLPISLTLSLSDIQMFIFVSTNALQICIERKTSIVISKVYYLKVVNSF